MRNPQTLAVLAVAGALSMGFAAAQEPAPDRSLPIAHEGIPGALVRDGLYVERTLSGEETVHDMGFGTTPVLPIAPPTASAGYLAGCPCLDGTFENEPNCGLNPDGSGDLLSDTVDGGCNSTPEVYRPIALGETYCGTAAVEVGVGGARDTDWYELVLAQPTRVTWAVTAEFRVQLAIFGPSCPPNVVAITTAQPCARGRVSATLPAGVWHCFVAPTFGAGSSECGSQYTATLEESCELFSSEASFDAAHPDRVLEDFTDGNVVPAGICTTGEPLNSAGDGGVCFDVGDIETGVSVRTGSGAGIALLDAGVPCNGLGGPDPTDEISISPATFPDSTSFTFAPVVRAVGLTLESCGAGPADYVIDVFRPGGVLLESRTVTLTGALTFIGFSCTEPIDRVTVNANAAGDGFAVISEVRFAPFAEAVECTTYANPAVFDALYTDLAFEDFEDGNVPPGMILGCALDPVDGAGDGGVCFDPGDIEPGLSLGSLGGTGIVLFGADYFGTGHSNIFSANVFAETTVLEFTPAVREVGLVVSTAFLDDTVVATLRDTGGALIDVQSIAASTAGVFWGVACTRPIARIELANVDIASTTELVDDLRYGNSKRNLGIRYCSPNLPNSTGDSGLVIVTGSTVDADDDLTLTALQLPTNSNIGYFIMGTGTNSFIPAGAGSFLCVAPGLKRYLGPVNNTNQFPGGFDRVVGTQGNGHPVSANITAGSTWNFQAWHRDSAVGTSHFTDAVSVTFH